MALEFALLEFFSLYGDAFSLNNLKSLGNTCLFAKILV